MNNDVESTMVDYPIPIELRAKALERKTGKEPFHEGGVPIDANLRGYWQWSASDLLGNTERGRLAEYIVATAVGVDGGVRSGWEPYDPLNLGQWEFYVLSARTLDERAPLQKTISPSSLLKLGARKVSYRELRDAIERSMAVTSANVDKL